MSQPLILPFAAATVPHLTRDWRFVASPPTPLARLARLKTVITGVRPAPPSRALRVLQDSPRWNGYFLFLGDGQLTPRHRYTLARLRMLRGRLLVICATPTADMVPPELLEICDAVYWKGLSGYDFSAYAIALREVALRSSGADLLLLNDSVFGPFGDLDTILDATPWQLTGFTASSGFENHLQSYALYWRNVTMPLVHALRTVMPRRVAFNDFQDVVNWQETRLGRVASCTRTVGALWFGAQSEIGDPSLTCAVPLLRAGFPFLKRSLFGGKLSARADQDELRQWLGDHGHPCD